MSFRFLRNCLALSFRCQCSSLLSLPPADDPHDEEDEEDERDDGRCVNEEDEEVLESEGDADAYFSEGVLHQESDVGPFHRLQRHFWLGDCGVFLHADGDGDM